MTFALISDAQLELIDFGSCIVYRKAIHVYSNTFRPYFLIFMVVAQLQTKWAISKEKHAISLKLAGGLVLG